MTMRFALAFALKNWLLITLLGPQTNFANGFYAERKYFLVLCTFLDTFQLDKIVCKNMFLGAKSRQN